ncbi:zinc ribbon domain-containing protein [Feifania hominis]|uniref:Zinc ribbon domain-containing protein n=1 Tax=Feifania hominis TaxID=2763660 RepID=A0A926DDL6_9FIRM|nr:zinc ribbon domain-containing protein [Feifania hominis]MBC8535854.1 zinc ribbon domain-containing protein [Feifania hominis]
MFFFFGILPGEKVIPLEGLLACPRCGRLTRVELVVHYQRLSLFFIPLFTWGRHYFVRMSCCGAACEIDSRIGRRMERGEQTTLDGVELHFSGPTVRRCQNCGYETTEDFSFCPRCGGPL